MKRLTTLFKKAPYDSKEILRGMNEKKPDMFRNMSYNALNNMGIKDVVNGKLIFLND